MPAIGSDTLTALVQVAGITASLVGGGVLFGLWDRKMRAKEFARTDGRAEAEEARKDRAELRADRDAARVEAATERDKRRALQVEVDKAWAKLHALDRYLHWWIHRFGGMLQAAYSSSRLGIPLREAVPVIPKIQDIDVIESWEPPELPLVTPEMRAIAGDPPPIE